MTLTPKRIQDLRSKLREREQLLRKIIHDELMQSDNKTYGELAGRVLDSGEQAVTDVLTDVRIAELQQEVAALTEIMAAQARIEEGSYGLCEDCGTEIDVDRLEAHPAAKRCIACQSRRENLAKDRTPSL